MFNNMNFSYCDRWVGKIIWGPFSFHKSKNLGGFLLNKCVISLYFFLLCGFPNNPKTPKAAAQILDNGSWGLHPAPSFFHGSNASLVIPVTPELHHYLDTDASRISKPEASQPHTASHAQRFPSASSSTELHLLPASPRPRPHSAPPSTQCPHKEFVILASCPSFSPSIAK